MHVGASHGSKIEKEAELVAHEIFGQCRVRAVNAGTLFLAFCTK